MSDCPMEFSASDAPITATLFGFNIFSMLPKPGSHVRFKLAV